MGVTTLLNGTLGFAMLLALLFCMPSDLESILGLGVTYPFMNIFAYGGGSKAGATALVSRSSDPLRRTNTCSMGFVLRSSKYQQ